MNQVRVVDPADVEPAALAEGVASRRVFETEDASLVVNTLEAGAAVPWHTIGRDIYAFVRAGQGRIEYGVDGASAVTFAAGDFVHVPAGTVHRTATEDGVEFVAALHGDGEFADADPPAEAPENPPRVAGPDDLEPVVEAPGVARETPFPGGDVLLLRVRASAGADIDWHHHGDNVSFGYVRDGQRETAYVGGGADVESGECICIPPGLVHRDVNPTDDVHEEIVWLCGGEPWVVDVGDPPE